MFKNIITSLGEHREKKVIFLSFDYNKELIAEVKKIPGACWSQSKKCWYVMDRIQTRLLFGVMENEIGFNKNGLNSFNEIAFKNYIQLLEQKAYSKNTIKTYGTEFVQFLKDIKNEKVDFFPSSRINNYLHYCIKNKGMSENQLHSRINAIKFYYEQVLKNPKLVFDVVRPKKKFILPKALSVEEVKLLLNSCENKKHQLMLALCYGTGIRLSEIVGIRLCDIDFNRAQLFVNCAKGKKDRYVNLPLRLEKSLKKYIATSNLKEYLFEGQYGGQYSTRSVQAVFGEAKRKAKILKPIGIHGLRHSYATHLLEMGTDISMIQRLLGHNQIKTTLIYTHISNKDMSKVKSPLDNL